MINQYNEEPCSKSIRENKLLKDSKNQMGKPLDFDYEKFNEVPSGEFNEEK